MIKTAWLHISHISIFALNILHNEHHVSDIYCIDKWLPMYRSNLGSLLDKITPYMDIFNAS